MNLVIPVSIQKKMAEKEPPITEKEIRQCFMNRDGTYLYDTRIQHATNPPTQWFVAETDRGILVKVVFIKIGVDIHIKSAYVPNPNVIQLYKDKAY